MRIKKRNIRRGGRRAISVFLTVLMLLTAWVFVAPETLPQASATTTALTDLPSSGNISGRYKVTSSMTATGLVITGTTVIYIASGATLTAQASGTTAGIKTTDKTLIITGPGKLTAKGVNGGNGGNGSGGGSPDGGAGGSGGYGGGAGIGGNGGDGGAGGAKKTGRDHNGNDGSGGSGGGAGGTVYILDSVGTVSKSSGSTGSGGSGGGGTSGSYTNRGGGGGGGGGGGYGGAAIGGGGGGGGGGGSGASGDWGTDKSGNKGRGGSGGADNGSKGTDSGSRNTGGSGGGHGASGGAGTLYEKQHNASSAPSNAKGTVTFNKNNGTATLTTTGSNSTTCTIGYAMNTKVSYDSNAANLTAPARDDADFDGYWTTDTGGTKYYNYNMTSAHVYDYHNLDLYAHWKSHNFSGAYRKDPNDSNKHQRKCTNSGCSAYGWGTVKGASQACSGGTATCTGKATCSSCQMEYGNPLGHNYNGDYVQVSGTNQHYRKCERFSACGTYGLINTQNSKEDCDWTKGTGGEEATCTVAAKCGLCKQRYGDPKGHDFTSGTYQSSGAGTGKHKQKCIRCNTYGDEQSCSGGTATCTLAKKCTKCNTYYGSSLGHSYTGDYVQVSGTNTHYRKCARFTADDCGTYGLGTTTGQTENCSVGTNGTAATCTDKPICGLCGQSFGQPNGHNFTPDPSRVHFVEVGKHNWKCADCNEYGTVADGVGGTVNCTAAQAWTTTESQHYKECTVCGGQATPSENHDLTNYVYNGNGTHQIRCTVCDYESNAAAACSEKATWETDATDHWKICELCEGITTAKVNHSGGEATCVAQANCTVCGEAYGSVNATNHSWGVVNYSWSDDGKTCTATRSCTRTGCNESQTEIATVSNGKITSAEKTAPQCLVDGTTTYTATFTNTALGTRTKDVQDIPQLGHSESSTWTTDGTHHWKVCTRCGAITTAKANHTGGTATCVAKRVCTVCSVEYGTVDASAHNFTPDPSRINNLENGTHNWECALCHEAYGIMDTNNEPQQDEAVECTYGEWVVVTEPTCTGRGNRYHTCTVCGYEETNRPSALGHNMTPHAANVATCTTDGNTAYWSCSRCEKYFSDVQGRNEIALNSWVLPALGHDFSASNDRAHYVSDNAHNFECARCHAAYGIMDGNTPRENSTVPCTPGDWSADTATCTAGGSHFRTCSVCANVETEGTPALGHNFSANNSRAHYADNDEHNFKCTRFDACGAYGVVENGAQVLDGTVSCSYPSKWTNASATQHSKTCTVCAHVKYANHTGGTATCEQEKKCSDCGAYYGGALGHAWDFAGEDYAVVYTWTGYTSCKATVTCKNNPAHKSEFTATGDSITSEITTTANCVRDGIRTYTAHFANGIADATTTENLGTAPAVHTDLQHTAAIPATCGGAGNIEYWYCSGCQKYFSDDAGTVEITQAQTVDPQKEHSYTGTARNNNDGTHSFLCVNGCGGYGNTEAHTWDEGVVTTQPTCTVDGVKTYTCTADGCGASYTEVVTMLGHEYTGEYVQVDGTNTHYRKCERFDECGTYGLGTTPDATEACSGGTANCVDKAVCQYCNTEYGEVDRNNHKAAAEQARVAPTCEEVGYEAGVYCSACETWVSGHAVIAKLGHNYSGAYHPLAGEKHNRACVNDCGTYGLGSTKNDEEACTASGDWVTSDADQHWKICSKCEQKLDSTAANHSWEWITDTYATCTTTGLKHEECAVCHKTRNVDTVIDALGHDFSEAAARIHSNGDGTHNWSCARCNDEVYGIMVDNQPQIDGSVACPFPAYTDNLDGTESRECPICHYVDTQNIVYTVSFVYSGGKDAHDATGSSANYEVDSPADLPALTKAGYTFTGWAVTTVGGNWLAADTIDSTATKTPDGKFGNVTLTAQWVPTPYKVTFDANGGVAVAAINYNIESTTTIPDTTRNGYTFQSWKVTTADGSWIADATFSGGTSLNDKYGNVTLTAQWSANPIKVILDNQGADTAAGTAEVYYTFDADAYFSDSAHQNALNGSITIPEKANKDFSGYFTEVGGTGTMYVDKTGAIVHDLYKSVYENNTTLYAHWTHDASTLVISAGDHGLLSDGHLDATLTMDADTVINVDDPTPDAGYLFDHWNITGDGNGTYDSANKTYKFGLVEDKTDYMTAVYSIIPYTLSFEYGGGKDSGNNTSSSAAYDVENTVTLPTLTRAGYTFAGWKVTAAAGSWIADRTIDADVLATTVGEYGTAELTAQWTPTPYKITFNANGGDDVAEMDYDIESTSVLPGATRTGYTFQYWKVTTADGSWLADATFAKETSLTGKYGNVTLTAQWEINASTLNINYGAHGTEANRTESGVYQQPYQLADPNPADGYEFTEWALTGEGDEPNGSFDSETKTYIFGATAGAADTITAHYSAIDYTITYTMNGGTNAAANPETYNIEDAEITLEAPSKAGYTFIGWTGTGIDGETPQLVVKIAHGSFGVRAYTANWTPTDYTIIYNLNDGTNAEANPASYNIESDSITLAAPSKTGYTFTGWSGTDITGTSMDVTIPTGSYGEREFTANWTLIEYTATFDSAGGSAVAEQKFTIVSADITLPTDMTRDGYTFTKWVVEAADEGWTVGADADKIATGSYGNVTFKAIWKAIDYDISYDLAGGTVSGNPIKYNIETLTFTLINPTRTGYIFSGWTGTGLDGATMTVTIETGSTGLRSYVATWTAITYKIAFDAAGGTGAPATIVKTYDTDISIPSTIPTRPGYNFGVWKIGEEQYTAGALIERDYAIEDGATVTLTAFWNKGTYSVSYVGNAIGDTVSVKGIDPATIVITPKTDCHLVTVKQIKSADDVVSLDMYTAIIETNKKTATITFEEGAIVGNLVITITTESHIMRWCKADNDNCQMQCEVCHAPGGEPTPHSFIADWTDTGDGYNHSKPCSRCGELIIAAHNGGTATCSKKSICVDCGANYGGYDNHVLTKTEAVAATCTKKGATQYWTCANCGHYFNDAAGTQEISLSDTVTDRIPHIFEGAVKNNGNGTHSFLCTYGCGIYGGAVSHVYDQEIVAEAYYKSSGSCTDPAEYYMSCICGAKGNEAFPGTPIGHSYVTKPGKPATCYEAGYTDYQECTRCGEPQGKQPIAALGHGNYLFDNSRSGKVYDGTFEWTTYSCSRGCGDHYVLFTIYAKDNAGRALSGANVSIVGDGVNVSGTTGAAGMFMPETHFADGEYTVTINYQSGDVSASSTGNIRVLDGKSSGGVGVVTLSDAPVNNDNSGGGSSSSDDGFRCSMCSTYEENRSKPVIGVFYSIAHFFVHMIEQITGAFRK